ncbi:MAG: DUF5915 domain-containing protein, partial [Propionibacteriaceae bacterium]|nr:DUF5915 domain-containing protein [Propionibacteriaceae bacterium]
DAKAKTRQPLRRALVSSNALGILNDELLDEIKAELNVLNIESFAAAGDLVDFCAKGNFRALGKRFGKQTQLVANAIAAADAAAMAVALKANGTVSLEVAELGVATLTEEEVLVLERPREGWSVVNEQGETIALDLELDDGLIQAGIAREVVRLIQEARKTSGFEVSDRIALIWSTDASETGELTARSIRAHGELIAEEVLALDVIEGEGGDFFEEALGLAFAVSRVQR